MKNAKVGKFYTTTRITDIDDAAVRHGRSFNPQ